MHIPVLKNEVLKYLDPKPNENFIDCTIDGGGHALAILKMIEPEGKLMGIDRDEEIISQLKSKIRELAFETRLILVCDNFVNLKRIVSKKKFKRISGVLFDLGMSSWHLKESGRGFSFTKNEPLIMKYDAQSTVNSRQLTAKEIINRWPEKKIVQILREYGEEKFAKRIAKEIVKERKKEPIETTFQLVEIIKKAVPAWYQRARIHFATRTFQALRIAVNDELTNLKEALPQALEVLGPKGKIVVISFHSLEDRIAKNFFKAYGGQERKLKVLTKKPVRPTKKETRSNPSSRSAKLRAAIKL